MKRNKSKAESLSKEEIISKRSARRFVMFISLSFIISFFVFLIGYFLRDSAVDDSIVKTNIWIIIVVLVLPVVNALLRKFCFSRKLEDRLYKKRETICQQNVNCHFRRLRFIRIVSDAYAVVLAVISVWMAFSTSFGNQTELFALFYFCSVFLLYAALLRVRFPSDTQADGDQMIELDENEYPTLYSLARQAAKQVSCDKDFCIVVTNKFDVSVLTDSKVYLSIGTPYWNVMSEEELYHTFLHEFAHVNNPYALSQTEYRLRALICNGGNHQSTLSRYASKWYSFLNVWFDWQFLVCDYVSSLAKESCADSAVLHFGSPAVMASCLMKNAFHNLYEWETLFCDKTPFYESESPDTAFYRAYIPAFKHALISREPVWRKWVEAEILSRCATHPTTKMRIEALGVTQFSVLGDSKCAELVEELDKADEHIEKVLSKHWKHTYLNNREIEYLDVLKQVERWKQDGEPLSDFEQTIVSLGLLGRFSQAEALCDRVLVEFPKKKCGYALLIKGLMLLHRYDDNGISHIYDAIRCSKRYFDAGVEAIGTYCCLTGNSEQLEVYRSFVDKHIPS